MKYGPCDIVNLFAIQMKLKRSLNLTLKHIINLSLTTVEYPFMWKLSKVISVLKKGDKSIVSNYRPISMISNFYKHFEMNCVNIYSKHNT